MKSVMISINPEWVKKIVDGDKTLEVRKTAPTLTPPFKCYIYCTYGIGLIERYDADYPNLLIDQLVSKDKIWGNCCNGKVVAEFICNDIRCIVGEDFIIREDAEKALKGSGLTPQDAKEYAGWSPGTYISACKPLYGWHISDLKVYDKPKALSEFKQYNRKCYYSDLGLAIPNCWTCHDCNMKRPPQSWCYVESLEA